MKNIQAQFWLSLLSAIYINLILLSNLDSDKYKIGIAIGIIITFLVNLFIEILENINIILIYILSKTIYRKYEVRFSVAYLFAIKIEDSYLVVYNDNRQHYQMVGGVYKKFPEANEFFDELKIINDKILPTIKEKKDDLRVFMPMKNASKFIKWFKKEKFREISPCREFYEELVTPGLLPQSPFLYVNFKKKGTIVTPIQHKVQDNWKYKQIQIFDIFELIPNEEQYNEFIKFLNRPCSEVKYVSEKLIMNDGYENGKKVIHIAETVKWAIKMKYLKQ